MACPKCGSETLEPGGRCAVCGAPGLAGVATAVLTPAPKAGLGRENAGSEDGTAATRLGDLVPSGEPGPEFGRHARGDNAAARRARPFAAGGPLGAGQAFGTRYHVVELLGAGGMGAVYQAWDQELGVAVALKVIRPEAIEDPEAAAEMQRRFKRELLLARQVTHRTSFAFTTWARSRGSSTSRCPTSREKTSRPPCAGATARRAARSRSCPGRLQVVVIGAARCCRRAR